MNLKEIINYKTPTENYYDILGCSQSSTIDQINKEYKIRALKFHPDKNPDTGTQEKFTQLQIAKNILTNESTRSSYDQWLNSGLCIPFEQWRSRKTHPMMHWASSKPGNLKIQGTQTPQGQGSECIKKYNNQTGTPVGSDEAKNKE